MRLNFTHESDFRQERDFGQKISATFEFIGAHWRPLGRILLYLVVPATLVQHILSAMLQVQMQGSLLAAMQGPHAAGANGALGIQRAMWGTLFNSPEYWISSVVGTAVYTMLILSVYGYVILLARRREPGPEVTVAEVWNVVRSEFLGTFFSTWGVFLLVGVAFFLLFVPGLYLSVALSLFFIVKLSEGGGFGATISRCLRLTRGKWWSTFGLLFIMVMIVYVVLAGVGLVAALASGGFTALMRNTQERSALFTVALTSVSGVLMLLLYPPLLLVLAFQYFNLVERKDAVGLRHLVNSLGQTPAPQVHNAAYQPNEEGEY